ncbi:MAG: hypothetical protein IJY15_08965 [Thermoguttaceae bacterium]|nr:hypothetical protein [Thermoguttaceae bacterium]
MKKDLFQRIFERKNLGSKPSARRLSLEALENRELLNADWGGFAPEKTTEFASTSAEYSVDFSERAPNFCELTDLNADGVDELLTINYSGKTLDVYSNDGTGEYVLKKSIAIAELTNANDSPVVFSGANPPQSTFSSSRFSNASSERRRADGQEPEIFRSKIR